MVGQPVAELSLYSIPKQQVRESVMNLFICQGLHALSLTRQGWLNLSRHEMLKMSNFFLL
jgi:hypothetical protein